MVIGIDFDNTIVCYDRLFHRVAVERGLVPADVPSTKGSVRDYLRQCDREHLWTELQGYVYGARMREALPFPGVREFLSRCKRLRVPTRIISHKSLHPFLGPKYDLHAAAHHWLGTHGFYETHLTGLSPLHVHFELTKADKLTRISQAGCTWFIDDLPEFLAEAEFPSGAERILFDPNAQLRADSRRRTAHSWSEVEEIILCGTSLRT